jgi:hypothetical protein
MSLKTILFSLGCVLSWFVLLPVFLIVGGIALFGSAALAELGAFLKGSAGKTLDSSGAREIARHMCAAYRAPARNTQRRLSR